MPKTIEIPLIRDQLTHASRAHCDECQIEDFGPSLTKQSDLEDSDINNIVRRFGLTGQIPENNRIPTYGDFSDVVDYRTALHRIQEADTAFMTLPANIRARFDNDPQQYLEFCVDPANLPELKKLGLAKAEAQGAPTGPTGTQPTNDGKPPQNGSGDGKPNP